MKTNQKAPDAQHARFVEAARRAAGADVDSDVADRLAKTKPEAKQATKNAAQKRAASAESLKRLTETIKRF